MTRKNKKRPARDHLLRPESHVTDEQARLHFLTHTPAEWVRNPLAEDYGKDYHVELTEGGGRVGRAFYVQLKGTRHCRYADGGATVCFPLERRHLAHYAAQTALPVFLVIVDVVAGRGFWLFLQEYLAGHAGWDAGASHTLRIPAANRLEDAVGFTAAVMWAMDWMAESQQQPLGDRARAFIRALEAKDPRYRVKATFSEEVARLELVPTEPVDLCFRVRPKGRRLQGRMAADFFERGLPVEFGAGELVVEGSALIHDLAAPGGTFRLEARAECQLTLTVLDERGEATVEWPGIPGALTGGTKEWRFQSSLARCPLAVAVGPLGAGVRGAIDLSVSPREWLGQPLLTASYFDRLVALVPKLAGRVAVRARCEVEGNAVFDHRATLDGVERFAPMIRFLRLVEMAREVARHFALNPTCTGETLGGEALRDIEAAHALLTTGRYDAPPDRWRVSITFDRAVARLLVGDPVIRDVVLFADEGTRLPFMGEQIDLGRLASELTEAVRVTPDDELARLLARPGEGVTVRFRTAPTTRRSIRRVSDAEWAEFLATRGAGQE